MKRVLRIAVLPAAAGAVALVVAVFLGVTSNGNAAPFAGKWCSGQKIVFFPGGPAGGVFAVNVYNGAKQAAADLGADVRYVWSNWDVVFPGYTHLQRAQPVQVGHRDQPRRHRRHGASR